MLLFFFYGRFLGTGVKVSYEQRQRSASRHFSTDMSIEQMEFLECLFPTDFHSVPPHYTEVNVGHSPGWFLDLFCFLKN